MIKRLFILVTLISFFMISPSEAIQRKDKGQEPAKNAKKNEQNIKAKTDFKEIKRDRKTKSYEVKQVKKEEPKKDKFTDKNDDGINDELKKTKKVKIKKKKTPDSKYKK